MTNFRWTIGVGVLLFLFTGIGCSPQINDSDLNSSALNSALSSAAPPSVNYPAANFVSTLGGGGNESITAMAVDGNANFYVLGSFSNDLANSYSITDFNGHPLAGKSASTGSHVFVAKLNSSGVQQWVKSLVGTNSSIPRALAVDGSGNVIVGGSFANNLSNTNAVQDFAGNTLLGATVVNNADAFIAKLDATGAQQWIKILGGTNNFDAVASVSVDGSGNVYAAGYFNNNTVNVNSAIDFAGNPLPGKSAAASMESYLAKLNSNGIQQWIKVLGGASVQQLYCVTIDGSGNIYLGGMYFNDLANTNNVVDFSGNPLPGKTAGAAAVAMVQKLDSSATPVWTRGLGGGVSNADAVFGIAVDGSGNVYAAGNYINDSANANATVDFAGASLLGKSSTASLDGFVAKLDSTGAQQWIKTLGGTGDEYFYAVAVDPVGNVYVGGRYVNTSSNSSAVIGMDGAVVNGKSATSGTDGVLAKLNTNGALQWVKTMGGSSSDAVTAVALDGAGNIYTGGYLSNDLTNTKSVTDLDGALLIGKAASWSMDSFIAVILK